MIPIAESRGVTICAQDECFLSFTNSPYYAHRRLASVDVYPRRGVKVAYTPVQGKVLEAGKLKLIDDYILAIQTENTGVCVKLLHVKPEVKVGERVSPGDVIGRLVWSPFFDFWTDPHVHIEVRPADDWLRAKGGYTLDPKPLIEKLGGSYPTPRTFRVEEALSQYVLLTPDSPIPHFTTPLTFTSDGITFVMEGGLPHYGHGALWTGRAKQRNRALKDVKESFEIDFVQSGYLHFTCSSEKIVVKGNMYRGIGLYLNDPHIKLIPRRPGEGTLKVGDEISREEILPFMNKYPE